MSSISSLKIMISNMDAFLIVFLLNLSFLLIPSIHSAPPAVRDAGPELSASGHPPAVRDAQPSRQDGAVRNAVRGVNGDSSRRRADTTAASVTDSASGDVIPAIVVDGGGGDVTTASSDNSSPAVIVQPDQSDQTKGTQQTGSNVPTGNNGEPSLEGIRQNFVGGLKAIGNSGAQLVGLGVNSVEQGVMSVVRPVVEAVDDVKQGVVNGVHAVKEGVVNAARPVINAANTVGHAGTQIAGAWGNSFQQTKNITGQLFENLG